MTIIVDVEHTNVRFLGNLVLNLWDCGGQYRFFESYFENDTIFRNVEVLIYVFGKSIVFASDSFPPSNLSKPLGRHLDIDSVDPTNDMTLFMGVMEAMERCSPDASIFILVHKMDLVAEDDREREFAERAALVQSKSQQ
jgi:Ras-related GTP-binding protein A/B